MSSQTGVALDELLSRAAPPDPTALLAEAGWRTQEHPVEQIARTYGRAVPDPDLLAALNNGVDPQPPAHPAGSAGGGFVTAYR